MRRKAKKLSLNRETVRTLVDAELGAVAGGIETIPTHCIEDAPDCSAPYCGAQTSVGYCPGSGGCPNTGATQSCNPCSYYCGTSPFTGCC